MKKLWWLVLALLLLWLPSSVAERAMDVTKRCSIVFAGKKLETVSKLTDGSYTTRMYLAPGQYVQVSRPGAKLSGVMVRFFDRSGSLTAKIRTEGKWEPVAEIGTHLSDWMDFGVNVDRFRLYNTSKRTVAIAELNVYGPGSRPAAAHVWQDMDKADMMLLVAHPDDEVLWFGGLLPTYAGHRKLKVQVVYAAAPTPYRRLEALDALWTCGVHYYPVFLGLRDSKMKSLDKAYRLYGKEKVWSQVTRAIRTYRPDVMVTHAVNGEYGHGVHKMMADAAKKCVKFAANSAKYTETGDPWQVSKLYLHHEKKNSQHFNWKAKLKAFGGQTSYTIATKALHCHKSQMDGFWTMAQGEKVYTDNTLFGLWFSTVGNDVMGGDFMENIPTQNDPQT